MSELKTYDVVVIVSGQFAGLVQATSKKAAKQIAEAEFNEGNLEQFEEEVTSVTAQEVRS
jgi:hypothetical protein